MERPIQQLSFSIGVDIFNELSETKSNYWFKNLLNCNIFALLVAIIKLINNTTMVVLPQHKFLCQLTNTKEIVYTVCLNKINETLPFKKTNDHKPKRLHSKQILNEMFDF